MSRVHTTAEVAILAKIDYDHFTFLARANQKYVEGQYVASFQYGKFFYDGIRDTPQGHWRWVRRNVKVVRRNGNGKHVVDWSKNF